MAPFRPLALLLFALLVAPLASAQRLPTTVRPEHYDLSFTVDLEHARFDGTETIRVELAEPSRRIVLNAAEIQFRETTIASGSATQKATVSLDSVNETATLTVPQTIAKGSAEIHIRYGGQLNDKLRGFYLSRGKGRNYAVTQFESTDARRAFPCFDEPAFKATFDITLVIDRGDTAISNGRIVSDTPGPLATSHTLKFSTSPKMSSYLVAMAVGDFQCVAGQQDRVPIRICATPDKKDLTHIALESAEWILKFYDGYFDIKYPYEKLDVLGVPDFAAGAMENTAAIFYRETDLLAKTDSASVATRKNIASVLAHEMAHQWFGDLVTMQWWNDLWLNEGFATWMANQPLAAWKPEWNIPVDEAIENQTALSVDSLKSTRAIRTRVETPAEIEASFDAIAYEKGAAVLRMIEAYVGHDTFRTGVNAYLKAHAYGNATSEDFWSAITDASAKPVDKIMPTFVTQPGVPLIRVSAACPASQTQIAMTQRRFYIDPAVTTPSSQLWDVPVCFELAPTPGTKGRGYNACSVVDRPEETFNVSGAPCAPWVFANLDGHGYYRTEYAPEMLRAMAPHVEDALTAPERLSLIGDEWALVRAGHHSVAEYLALASGFGREHTAGVLSALTSPFAFMREYLTTDATRPKLETFVRTLLEPLFHELGFTAAAGDSDDRRELRAIVVDALGATADDPDVIRQSRAALDRALAGGPALDPTLADAVVTIAARHGDEKLYEALLSAADRTSSPEEHYRYLYAIAEFREPALIDRGLGYALSPQMRSQDAAIYLSRFMANPAARPKAWAFIKQHWSELLPKVSVSEGDRIMVSAASAFCEPASRDDVKSFFTTHKLPATARALEQTIERISNCIALKEKQAPVLAEWLESRKSTVESQ
jgi:aminopeptidase N